MDDLKDLTIDLDIINFSLTDILLALKLRYAVLIGIVLFTLVSLLLEMIVLPVFG